MLKVIDTDIEIIGVVNFTFSSPLFIYDGSLTVLFRSVTRTKLHVSRFLRNRLTPSD